MVTLMPSSNFTSIALKSSTQNVQTGSIATNILVIILCIMLITIVLLLVVRRYFSGARKCNTNNDTLNTHSIKYISDKQLNKIHIDTNAEDVLDYEKDQIDPHQLHNSECESNLDVNEDKTESIKTKNNIFDRVKHQLCRPTILAAPATTARYRNLNETI